MEQSKADQNPSTSKPFRKEATKSINEALITNVNKPSVRKFMGRVSIIKIGLTTRFNNPNTTAPMIAV